MGSPAIVCPRSNRLAECVTPGGSPPPPPISRPSASAADPRTARSRASSLDARPDQAPSDKPRPTHTARRKRSRPRPSLEGKTAFSPRSISSGLTRPMVRAAPSTVIFIAFGLDPAMAKRADKLQEMVRGTDSLALNYSWHAHLGLAADGLPALDSDLGDSGVCADRCPCVCAPVFAWLASAGGVEPASWEGPSPSRRGAVRVSRGRAPPLAPAAGTRPSPVRAPGADVAASGSACAPAESASPRRQGAKRPDHDGLFAAQSVGQWCMLSRTCGPLARWLSMTRSRSPHHARPCVTPGRRPPRSPGR